MWLLRVHCDAVTCNARQVRSSPVSGGGGALKRSDEERGLLWLLDEEAIYPGATDVTFLQRFLAMHKHETSQ